MNKQSRMLLYGVSGFLVIAILLLCGYFIYSKYNGSGSIRSLDNISLPGIIEGPNRNDNVNNVLGKDQIILLTNNERASDGETILEESSELDEAANKKLDDMFAKQYFEHISPYDGSDISNYVLSEGYEYVFVGENLAMGDFANEQEMVDAWMNSPGHRENILNPKYTQTGVAVKKGDMLGRNTWVAVQVFGKQTGDCEMPDQSILEEINYLKEEYKSVDEKNDEIESLQSEASELIQEGNDNIKKGNEIYSQSSDTQEAQKYWTMGEQQYNEGVEKNNAANKLIDKINSFLDEYSTLDDLITNYNSQVDIYNKCISG